MTDTNTLYTELKHHIESVAMPLINISMQCLRDRSGFLPPGAQ